jgi:hypothetical protein
MQQIIITGLPVGQISSEVSVILCFCSDLNRKDSPARLAILFHLAQWIDNFTPPNWVHNYLRFWVVQLPFYIIELPFSMIPDSNNN